MSNPKNELRINIGFIINQSVGYYRDFHFDIPEIELPPDLFLMDFHGQVRINRTPQGLLVNGNLNTITVLECVRCLASYRQQLTTKFDELYAFNKRSVTDSGLLVPEDGYIDLEPLVREYLLIEIPINPLCRQVCMGLCTICGANWNSETCSHRSL